VSAAPLRPFLFALVACGTAAQGPATPVGSGSAVRDERREASQDPAQETKPVKATATVLASATDSFEYKVGNPHFHGRTIVRVTGDGNAEASFEQGGKTQRYTGTVPATELAALRDSLTRHPLDSYKPPTRHAVPDEATMEFTLVTGGVRTEAELLDNTRHEIAALGELVDVIQEIASKVSGGKIEY
jgi:hypothetical protein